MNTQKMTKKNDLAIVNTHIACGGEMHQTINKPYASQISLLPSWGCLS